MFLPFKKKKFMKPIRLAYTAFALFSASCLFSCSKNFLDDPKPTQSVSSEDVFGSDAGVRTFLTGIYRDLRTQWGTSTDAWGIASVHLAREIKGLDALMPTSNWYVYDYLHDNREATYRRTSFTWRFFYELVNQANNVIAGVASSTLEDDSKKAFIAEGKAIRGWAYFELAREFCQPYSKGATSPGLPLYTTPTTIDVVGNTRGTIAETYTQILSDLEGAVTDIPTSRDEKDQIDLAVVEGLLARVYLEMGTWGKARDAAIAARNSGESFPLTASECTQPFNNIARTEWMWGFPQSADQTIYYGTPSAFWGYDGTIPGYYNFYVDSSFVQQFSATDVRKQTFYETGETDFSDWKTSKFGTTTSFTDHLPAMRVPEMYLIEAEARASLGDASAGDILFEVQSNRDASAVKSGNTGTALINEILLERRKELFGEIGVGFEDCRRKGLPLVRDEGHGSFGQISLSAYDVRYTLKIPKVEFDANTNLTSADQNP